MGRSHFRLGADQRSDTGLVWVDRSEGAEVALPREPGLNFLHRAWLKVLSLAPIEHLL